MAAEQPQAAYSTEPGPSQGENPANYLQNQPIGKSEVNAAQGYVPPPGYPHQPPAYQQSYSDPTAPPPSYNTTTNAALVSQQPAVIHRTRVDPGTRPKNYILISIINLLACFFVLGIIALVFSLQVDSAWESRNYEEACQKSRIAKVFNIIGIAIGSVIWSLIAIYVFVQIVFYIRLVYD